MASLTPSDSAILQTTHVAFGALSLIGACFLFLFSRAILRSSSVRDAAARRPYFRAVSFLAVSDFIIALALVMDALWWSFPGPAADERTIASAKRTMGGVCCVRNLALTFGMTALLCWAVVLAWELRIALRPPRDGSYARARRLGQCGGCTWRPAFWFQRGRPPFWFYHALCWSIAGMTCLPYLVTYTETGVQVGANDTNCRAHNYKVNEGNNEVYEGVLLSLVLFCVGVYGAVG